MSKQLTAVEFIKNQLLELGIYSQTLREIMQEADEMFEKQIKDCSKNSYIAGYLDNQCKVNDSSNFPEDYYNETFGTNE